MEVLEERECKICGVWFQPKRKNNIYCEECSKRSGAKKINDIENGID